MTIHPAVRDEMTKHATDPVEAFELAQMKVAESNLARCYLTMCEQVQRLRSVALVADAILRDEYVSESNAQKLEAALKEAGER